jgi:uncharacterized protein YndB with AHSA1/START domain
MKQSDAEYGSIEQLADGSWRLRFVRTLAHPRARVWRAVTEPDELAVWFPTTIEGERVAGSPLRFTFPKAEAPPFDGEVIAVEPESVFEFRWGPDVIRIELEPAASGTELRLYDTLEARGKAARDGAGWHTCLDELTAALDGRSARRAESDQWSRVHSRYVAAFGPEGSAIGPP